MSNTPEAIWANPDGDVISIRNGCPDLNTLIATGQLTKYVRADRIEELEKRVNTFSEGWRIADEGRIEAEAKLSESEALLAKAVEALDNVVVEYDLFRKYEYERGLSSLDDEIEDARTTLAELKGDKDE